MITKHMSEVKTVYENDERLKRAVVTNEGDGYSVKLMSRSKQGEYFKTYQSFTFEFMTAAHDTAQIECS